MEPRAERRTQPNFDIWFSSNLLSVAAVESSSAVAAPNVKPTIASTSAMAKSATTLSMTATAKPATMLATSVVASPRATSTGNGKIPASCSGAGAAVIPMNLPSRFLGVSPCFEYFVTCKFHGSADSRTCIPYWLVVGKLPKSSGD
jgi:hypothetical protein